MADVCSIWWSLPGPADLLSRVSSVLREGANVALAIPAGQPCELFPALRQHLREAGLELELLDVERAHEHSPVQMVRHSCGLEASVANAADVARSETFSGRALYIRGITASSWEAWRAFIEEYAAAVRGRAEFERGVFAFEVPMPTSKLPKDDVTLRIVMFRGHLSRLDLVLFASYLAPLSDGRPLVRQLHAYTVAELARFDGQLVVVLARCSLDDLANGFDRLRKEYAEQRGWKRGVARDWQLGTVGEVDGERLHHLCIPDVVDGDGDAAAMALWRAQIAVVFPAIERLRVGFIERYSSSLRLPWQTPFRVVEDRWDLEAADLVSQLNGRVNRGHQDALIVMRDARNRLAHLEPVPIADIRRLAAIRLE